MLKPVKSLADLKHRAQTNAQFEQLAIVAAQNLGGDPVTSLSQAMYWLTCNAVDSPMGEEGVIEEVNFCRSLIQ